MKIIPQIVKVRKHNVDVEKLKIVLKQHKTLSNNQIAESLDIPLTMVEHWFRKDKYFNIPDEQYWFRLKELLNIQDDSFDKSITEFEYRLGVFEKAERCYEPDDICPTILAIGSINIVEYGRYE